MPIIGVQLRSPVISDASGSFQGALAGINDAENGRKAKFPKPIQRLHATQASEVLLAGQMPSPRGRTWLHDLGLTMASIVLTRSLEFLGQVLGLW